ncbi:hypothetical protein LTR70_007586 [Exophiala xenobiotica]|uniref:Uncharacterized protein n=1 Tax=Lithohypha guttulata TaxID=1690604 RepID=A0ABR0JYE5_9EURO|nr:hypothetical protein LTR24_008943 [Lithohypha guttulata]KAK5313513.1 hypothetical protein LTR70_007586 [Exophiala xenobiotica]
MSLPGFLFANSVGVCKPDADFQLSFATYSPWKRDAIFAINMSFGSYSFGVAKLIDVSWDVGIGRGGQALLAYLTYKTFTKALTCSMESSVVSADVFEAITLQNDTIGGVFKLTKDCLQNRSARARGTMCCMILAALFVLILPTWLSAMTGYTAVLRLLCKTAETI